MTATGATLLQYYAYVHGRAFSVVTVRPYEVLSSPGKPLKIDPSFLD